MCGPLTLRRTAPHCYFAEHRTEPRGDITIQVCYTAEHACELYRLNGAMDNRCGITRPLRLKYLQQHKAAVQCCSRCGHPGHLARNCSILPVADPSDMDEGVTASDRRSVCHSCYSTDHTKCYTPPQSQQCRVCKETGHTSFRCQQYRSNWVRIDIPRQTNPPNQRPDLVLAQLRGLPPPSPQSWSAVAQRGTSTSHPTSHPTSPPPHNHPTPPSPYPASSTASPPHTPHLTPPPSPSPSELQMVVASFTESLKQLQLQHQEMQQQLLQQQQQFLQQVQLLQQQQTALLQGMLQQQARADARQEQLLSIIAGPPPKVPTQPIPLPALLTLAYPATPATSTPASAPTQTTPTPLTHSIPSITGSGIINNPNTTNVIAGNTMAPPAPCDGVASSVHGGVPFSPVRSCHLSTGEFLFPL